MLYEDYRVEFAATADMDYSPVYNLDDLTNEDAYNVPATSQRSYFPETWLWEQATSGLVLKLTVAY